jgi:hypothetical protein
MGTTTSYYPGTDGTNFGHAAQPGGTWASNHDSGWETSPHMSNAEDSFFYIATGTGGTGQYIYLQRGAFVIDTSGLGSGATISAASFNLYADYSINDSSNANYAGNIYSFSPANDTSWVTEDFTTYGTTAYCDTSKKIADWTINGYNSFVFNATGLAAISKTGKSKLGVRESYYDVSNTDPSMPANKNAGVSGFYSEQTGTSQDPYLSVTYTTSTAWTQDLNETISLTDALKKAPQKGMSQTINLTDALSKTTQKGLTDNPTMSDAMSKQATTIRSDTLSLADSNIKTFSKILTQTAITLADVLKRDNQKILGTTINLSDAMAKNIQARLSQTINLSDVVASDPRIVLAEILSLTDRLPVMTIGKFLTDSNQLADQIGEQQAGKGLNETIDLTDAQKFENQKAITDNLAITDALAQISAFSKAFAETLALSDAIAPQSAYQRAISENIALIDDITAVIVLNLALTENLALGDVLSFTAEKRLADSITITEVLDSIKQFFER